MEEIRPNPEALLAQLKSEESAENRGKLKIFFGYAAGVGKTFAMLEAAHGAKERGIDVVAGYIEPHTRPLTLSLLQGLPALPTIEVKHKGVTLKEFDIDGAIRRKPQLILVDELAHTNAAGCRHMKRYQDIEELLKLGVNVYTTVNVQHIESLNDIVASITGVTVRERIPDHIFDGAYQVELVDIEPDDLINRLNQGEIYTENNAKRALDNFFTKENLTALREIALRRAADRVNKIAEKTKSPFNKKNDYYTGEHILICLSGSSSNAKVIRTAARMAAAFHGSFTALFVETAGSTEQSSESNTCLRENLKLAEQLGARIATVFGEDIPYQIAEYAKISGISKIVIGRSRSKKVLFFKKQNLIERLTDLAPNLEIYVIPDVKKTLRDDRKKKLAAPIFSLVDTLKTVAILAIATLVGLLFYELSLSESNIIIVYILGVLITAFVTDGKLYGLAASVVSVFAFNFFFTEPIFTFQAFHQDYPATFVVMFLASIFTSTLAKRVKQQAHQASVKAYRTEVLLETSQKFQRAKNEEEILDRAARQMIKLLERDIVFYPVQNDKLGEPRLFSYEGSQVAGELYLAADEQAVANWVYKNNKHAGASTSTLPSVRCLYLAVRSNDAVFAVVGVAMEGEPTPGPFEKNLLLAMLSECALALEKESITQTKNRIATEIKQEQLRANLLRAISHDLRTPLTSISGNAGVLIYHGNELEDVKKMELYSDIYDDSMWLINLVENLLSITRIENGTLNITMQPEMISEVIEEALHHINPQKCRHNITVNLEDDLLMAHMDGRLIVQVVINLVDNAVKYTDEGSNIAISARREGSMIAVEIADDGEGISEESKAKLFQMFFTGDNQRGDGRRGLGLGLSLCKSIVEAHGGTIKVEGRQPKGTAFIFTLQGKEVKLHE